MSKVSKEHQIYNHELYYHTKEVISPIYLNLKKKKKFGSNFMKIVF